MKPTLYITHYGKNGVGTIWAGNIDQLTDTFGDLLESGHARDSRIENRPRGAAGFATSLNRSARVMGRFEDVYAVSSRLAFQHYGGVRAADGTGKVTFNH